MYKFPEIASTIVFRGWDSSVGIAPCNGLESSRFEFRCRQEIFFSSCNIGTGSLSRWYSAQGVVLTTYPHLAWRYGIDL
jgi:hypothetical protein